MRAEGKRPHNDLMIVFLATVAARVERARGSPLTAAEQAELRRLYEAHHAVVWRVARRTGMTAAQADDAAQQVFLVALGRLADITPGRERSFLCGCALMVARGLGQKHTRELLQDEAPDETAPGKRPDEEVEHRRNRAVVDRVLAKMEEPLRAVFVLQELEGLSKREAAEALEWPEGTVATRMRRARTQFDELLRQTMAEERR